MQNKNKIIK